jgi:SAM-dependent methyltransferase
MPLSEWGELGLSFLRRRKERSATRERLRELAASGDFDTIWYRAQYPDIPATIDPLAHYVERGWKEGRFPNPIFDTNWYLRQNSDVANAGLNPLAHYVKYGASEGRNPNRWFDAVYYRESVGGHLSGLTPVAHYLKQPPKLRLAPSRDFDALAYRQRLGVGAEVPDDLFCDFLHSPADPAKGWLGDVTSTYATGWASRGSGAPVKLTLRLNGVDQSLVIPWLRRPDVAAAGFGLISGFYITYPRRLAIGDIVEIVDEQGTQLLGSPRTYEALPLSPEMGYVRARTTIAHTFLAGHGLEIGAFAQPTDVRHGVTVDYYDKFSPEELRSLYGDEWAQPLVEPKYYGDAQTLQGIPSDIRFDFVVANHVIEHLEDPIRFLKTLAIFIKPGGRAFLAAPNKKFTFDIHRELTPFEHIARDHGDGGATSRKQHYSEWAERVVGLTGEAATQRATTLDEEDLSIHFHVWDESSFFQFLVRATEEFQIPFTPIFLFSADREIVVILQRSEDATSTFHHN